jgi:restriction system protein
MARLRAIHERVLESRGRYWDLSKSVRIDHGLRPDVAAYGYSANMVLRAIEAALFSAFAGRIPVECPQPEHWGAIKVEDEEIFTAKTAIELSERLEPLISGVEDRLNSAYEAIEREQNQ